MIAIIRPRSPQIGSQEWYWGWDGHNISSNILIFLDHWRKRRPTLKVDSMMVLRARRGGTGSTYVTLRGGLRRAIPVLLVRSGGVPQFYADKRPCLPVYCVAAKRGR
jgi:hypothetical protein